MNKQIVPLLYKSINGAAFTEEEKNELTNWYSCSIHNKTLLHEIQDASSLQNDIKEILRYDHKAILTKISHQIRRKKKSVSNSCLKYAVYHLCILFFLVSVSLFTNAKPLKNFRYSRIDNLKVNM